MEDYFNYLHLRFAVTKARRLGRTYKVRELVPKVEWISPFARGQPPPTPTEPILFATVVFEETPVHILIDGDELVRQTAKEGRKIKVIILNFADTWKVLTAPTKTKRQMKDEATKIGLFP